MIKKVRGITKDYCYTRMRTYKLSNESYINPKEFLWCNRKKGPDTIEYTKLMFLDENLFLTLPMPFKKYRY